mmetsp:Transcript_11016/g.30939  ORF Transcript_11016/g.30939 Transcript_11016/m.30939 type:complete len:394 (+) Transcript_11016:48-1229(+)
MGASCSHCRASSSPEDFPEPATPQKTTRLAAEEEVIPPEPVKEEESDAARKEDAQEIPTGGKFTLVLHSAKIHRSFAKFGHMDPYAIIDVDGKEVGRSKPDKSAHKEPHWESSFSWENEGVPKDIHIAVWDKNDFHRDVFIGAVTVPCSHDMGKQDDITFSLTKRSEVTGVIRLTLAFEHPERRKPKLSRTVSLGMELDNVLCHFSEGGQGAQVTVQLGETELHRQKSFGDPEGDAEPSRDRAQSQLTHEETSSAIVPLIGSWKCVETHGLDAFLKATGVGMFQRKIANAAKWPGWEYRLAGDSVVFVNHSAIGDLTEHFPIGKDYDWKDGHGNPMTCKAVWTKAPEGGTLLTERSGAIASYKEERKVAGKKLEFTLTHQTGVSWGRVFEKEP